MHCYTTVAKNNSLTTTTSPRLKHIRWQLTKFCIDSIQLSERQRTPVSAVYIKAKLARMSQRLLNCLCRRELDTKKGLRSIANRPCCLFTSTQDTLKKAIYLVRQHTPLVRRTCIGGKTLGKSLIPISSGVRGYILQEPVGSHRVVKLTP